MLPRALALSLLPLALSAAACGGSAAASSASQVAPNAPPPGEPSHAGPPAAPPTTNAIGNHKLAIAAVSCWFGGVWADAIGEPPENRKLSDEARCNDVVRQVWGVDDKVRYEQLRALDEATVLDVLSKVGEGTTSARMLRSFVEAQKEALDARRWGDKVKKDLTGGREPEKLTPDESSSSKFLQDADALNALLNLSVGDLTHEAHALGVMTAMERIESSRGLPRHIKIYAMQGPMHLLFGMPLPTNLPQDASQPLPKGAYLVFVADAAKAAGHPVADTVTGPREREPLAWAGVLAGITEKLKPDVDSVPKDSPLPDVLDRVVHRLEAEVKAEQNAQAVTTPGSKPMATPAPAAATPGTKKAPAK